MRFFLRGTMKLRSEFCFGVFLCAISSGTANFEEEESDEGEDLNQTFFISEIFNKYGNNNFMTFEGFEHLLENLGLGKLKFETKHDISIHKINGTFHEVHDELALHMHNHNITYKSDVNKRDRRNLREKGREKSLRRKCLTAQDILLTYGLQPYHEVVISPSNYLQICPAIVYELDQKICQVEETLETSPKQEERHLVWIYASISILVMSVSGMLCVLVVPLVKKNHYGSLLQFLISLGVGTLCGDALMHLQPQVFSRDEKQTSEVITVARGTVTLLAIYAFFIIENILKGTQTQKEGSGDTKEMDKILPFGDFHPHDHGHGHSHGLKSVAWMAIMGDILHNVTDGLSIGAAFGSSLSSGFASSIAIFCHELPHELGDYAILLASGMSVRKSLFYNFLSSVFSFLGMIAGVLLGKIEDASLWINAFTAGSFLYIALSDLVPELKIMQSRSGFRNFIVQTVGLSCGGILMFTIAIYENQIENMLS